MTQHTPSPEENVAQLRELALRLLTRSFDPQPQMLAGSFPASLPFDVPFPDGYQVIGSFMSTPEDILLLFDTEQSPAEIIAFYIQQMQAAGWSEPDILRKRHHHEGGFTHTAIRASYITLCKGRRGPALMVSASRGQNEGEKTQVRLNLDTRSYGSPCTQSSEFFIAVSNLIPTLEPPSGGHQWVGGGGGNNSESASTSATLDMESDITLPLLADHYTRQIEQGGWQRTGEGSTEPMAWSTWELRDKENERWMGVFTLLQVPGMEHKYYMQMNINWVEENT